ncbi:MAG: universal stress protein [Streptosporangiaceae bacterium]
MIPAPGGSHDLRAIPYRRVLVGWDASPDSMAALRAAAALASSAAQGCVVAMAVLSETHGPEHDDEVSSPVRRVHAVFESTRSAIDIPAGATISLHTEEGSHPARTLCEYAHVHGFDLMVLGRHGNGGLLHPKLGHIAHAVARASEVPVLLVSTPAGFCGPQ